jgi:ATP-dependent helicase/nuclease subunit A
MPSDLAIDRDRAARAYAVDPRHNVVLEASAGTGKTSVLVQRYLNLLSAGVDPANILAMTFTRKAAAEMRDRIIDALRQGAEQSDHGRAMWLALRDRIGEVAISTIDAFCFSLLREFPLEAGLDPGFRIADETETARLVDAALDESLRLARGLARNDEEVALVLARLAPQRLREALAHLLDRRLVVPVALQRYVRGAPAGLDIDRATRDAAARLRDAVRSVTGGLAAFLADGPNRDARFSVVAADLRALDRDEVAGPEMLCAIADSVRGYFLTQEGQPRSRPHGYRAEDASSLAGWRRHGRALADAAPRIRDALAAWARDVNVLLARGVSRLFAVTVDRYRRILAEHDVVDFPELVARAVELLRQMDEFSQSRYRLEARYHHVLVDEFQDTSRLQWDLVALLVESWGEGAGLAHEAPLPPSLFIVGDRKQSIYRFRDADVTLLDEAARRLARLRPDGNARRYISRSFRARPELLSFVNDVCREVAAPSSRADAFTYTETDRFPVEPSPAIEPSPLALVVGDDVESVAGRVAGEISRVLGSVVVRDRETGVRRAARPGDIAILFRSRDSHREFERALERERIPTYVYKGLGFFDSDEVKDLVALVRFLSAPHSNLRAAALMRSRLVWLSDAALTRLAPDLSAALVGAEAPPARDSLAADDRRVLDLARASISEWLALVDRVAPSEAIDRVLASTGYALELSGPRARQARENVKKFRALVRRIENRGYATLDRIAAHIDRLAVGDEANAVLEAVDAVSLMTVHASKGLEFPIVFVVNLARGVAQRRRPIRVRMDAAADEASVSVDAFLSDADSLEPTLEREETKRLLYVGLTRARDVLYLSTILKEGACKPGPGSLGSVLPASIHALLASAGTSADGTQLVWQGTEAAHRWRVARPEVRAEPRIEPPANPPSADRLSVNRVAQPALPFDADEEHSLDDVNATMPPARIALTKALRKPLDQSGDAAEASLLEPIPVEEHPDGRIVGRLVHRLMRRFRPGSRVEADALDAAARTLLTADERAGLRDETNVVERATALYRRLALRRDVIDLFRDADVDFEVPFSLRDGADVLRGTIDCLVRRPDGGIVVIEIKTGPQRPEHILQLDTYIRAVRALETGRHATGVLLHP